MRPVMVRVRGQRFGDSLHQRYDPNPRARRVFSFPQPATLARTLRDASADPERPTWRGKVTVMPELDIKMLRPAQITAISGIERSLAEQRFDRSPGADGHRCRQDLRCRDGRIPVVEAWRVQSGSDSLFF